jgi:hypothetical protein
MIATLRRLRPGIVLVAMAALLATGLLKCEGSGPHPFAGLKATTTALVEPSAAAVAQAQNQALGYNRMFIHARDIDVSGPDVTEYSLENETGGLMKGNGQGHLVTLGSTGYLVQLGNDGGACGPWNGTCFTFYDAHTALCYAASGSDLIETGCNGGLGCQQFTNPPTNGTFGTDWYSGCLWADGNASSCISADAGTDHTYFTTNATCSSIEQGYWSLEG